MQTLSRIETVAGMYTSLPVGHAYVSCGSARKTKRIVEDPYAIDDHTMTKFWQYRGTKITTVH